MWVKLTIKYELNSLNQIGKAFNTSVENICWASGLNYGLDYNFYLLYSNMVQHYIDIL